MSHDRELLFLFQILLMVGLPALIVVVGAAVLIVRGGQRERSRREIAAYIAEGTMTPEEGERLLRAAPGHGPAGSGSAGERAIAHGPAPGPAAGAWVVLTRAAGFVLSGVGAVLVPVVSVRGAGTSPFPYLVVSMAVVWTLTVTVFASGGLRSWSAWPRWALTAVLAGAGVLGTLAGVAAVQMA